MFDCNSAERLQLREPNMIVHLLLRSDYKSSKTKRPLKPKAVV